MLRVCLFAVTASLAFAQYAFAQYPSNAAKPGDDLYIQMERLDRKIFDAFNTCKLDEFKAQFEENVEFYHDQGGLTVGSATVTGQVRENICGKVRRELVPGSLKVYPMHGYGALMAGYHRFYQKARPDQPTGIAQFMHLVRKVNGEWKVTRVLSFDHVALDRPAAQ